MLTPLIKSAQEIWNQPKADPVSRLPRVITDNSTPSKRCIATPSSSLRPALCEITPRISTTYPATSALAAPSTATEDQYGSRPKVSYSNCDLQLDQDRPLPSLLMLLRMKLDTPIDSSGEGVAVDLMCKLLQQNCGTIVSELATAADVELLLNFILYVSSSGLFLPWT
ncbi:hypothetical protein AX15_006185 [Amanita polypyramis BW_CC]|nr:hypothetical protein AX15_006185 [Amanita polypyramis BW_CC]